MQANWNGVPYYSLVRTRSAERRLTRAKIRTRSTKRLLTYHLDSLQRSISSEQYSEEVDSALQTIRRLCMSPPTPSTGTKWGSNSLLSTPESMHVIWRGVKAWYEASHLLDQQDDNGLST